MWFTAAVGGRLFGKQHSLRSVCDDNASGK